MSLSLNLIKLGIVMKIYFKGERQVHHYENTTFEVKLYVSIACWHFPDNSALNFHVPYSFLFVTSLIITFKSYVGMIKDIIYLRHPMQSLGT